MPSDDELGQSASAAKMNKKKQKRSSEQFLRDLLPEDDGVEIEHSGGDEAAGEGEDSLDEADDGAYENLLKSIASVGKKKRFQEVAGGELENEYHAAADDSSKFSKHPAVIYFSDYLL